MQKIIFASLLMTGFSSQLHAQETAQNLPGKVVTAIQTDTTKKIADTPGSEQKTKTPVKHRQASKMVQLDEIVVTAFANKPKFPNTTQASPSFKVSSEDIETKINATTVEDTLRYIPGLNVRRRYIGDANAPMAMRGSNITQSAHSMVFADGMPLYNMVNAGHTAAPRWSMVSPSEIESVDVLFGPFSSQYNGHSFGGVVNLNTKMPDQFEAQMDATGMFQNMHRGGRNQLLQGFRTFLSGGDRIDKFSVYGFYNHLQNEGQPMDPVGTAAATTALPANLAAGATAIPVTSAQLIPSPTGGKNFIFGDSGIDRSETDLFKLKTAYDLTDDLQARFTIAYEERNKSNDDPLVLSKNRLTGQTLYSNATNAAGRFTNYYTQDGYNFTVPLNGFRIQQQNRQALNYGLSLQGKISDNWNIDTTASYYDAFKDRTIQSTGLAGDSLAVVNGRVPGQITDVDNWWATYDLKLATDAFLGRKDLSFMGGYQIVHGNNNSKVYNTNNYLLANRDSSLSDSGGQTQTNSLFSQLAWRFLPDWSVMTGLRFDHFQALDGHFYNYNRAISDPRRLQNYQDRDQSRISPKASIEYSPDAWTFRYSFSKAYRFPVAEELFASKNTVAGTTFADPNLGPENGYFHNLMAQYDIAQGFIRANLFYDLIDDEIFSYNPTLAGGNGPNTYLAIGQTETIGVDLTYRQYAVFGLPIDFMANTVFMNKQITDNPDATGLVGNEWPRIPKLQANVTATYNILREWDATAGVRYRSDMFHQITNVDTEANVFNGSDEYTLVDFKTNYRLPIHPRLKSTISAGIDNILDQDVYENNPLAQRTYYVSLSLKY
ncbi:TonB-dependent receptor [Methylobacter sp.]|uniref:TonB-dependent receptor n=1 Tax=Methylobacter sp. TaxID=2051955 RepID=UPI00121697AF|nr:TonB-dependent receptor [Methylobacter sp.]TAK64780.1 MAG: TonB-dependent receptor [Methylobacter sp.]